MGGEEKMGEFIALMIRIWHCCQFSGVVVEMLRYGGGQGKRATGIVSELPQVSLFQDTSLDDIISYC